MAEGEQTEEIKKLIFVETSYEDNSMLYTLLCFTLMPLAEIITRVSELPVWSKLVTPMCL